MRPQWGSVSGAGRPAASTHRHCPAGVYVPWGRQEMDKYLGKYMVRHMVFRATAKIQQQVCITCAREGVGGGYFL